MRPPARKYLALLAILWLATNLLGSNLLPVSGPPSVWIAGSLPFLLVGLLLWVASSRGWRFALFSLIPTLLIALLLEGGFRVYYHLIADNRTRVFLSAPGKQRLGNAHVYLPHHYTLYGLNPDYAGQGTRHNSLGFRDEREFPPDDQAIRIIFIGGSTTYTIRIADNKKIFTYKLEQDLNSRYAEELGTRRIEVINAGLGGATSAESLIRLALFASEVHPDLVVIQHGLNDVRARMSGTLRPDFANYRKVWEAPSPFSSRHSIAYGITQGLSRLTLLGNFLAHATHLTKDRQLAAYTNRPQEGDPAENLRRNDGRYFARNTRMMVWLARNMGAMVLLATPPFTDELPAIEAAATLEHGRILNTIADEEQVLFFDIASEMTRDDVHFPDSMHVSQEGSDQKRDLFFRYFVDHAIIESLLARHTGAMDGQ